VRERWWTYLGRVRILGIDLAAQPETTGCVVLGPNGAGRWESTELADAPADDDRLVAAARDVDVIGIDTPLGWPIAFVTAIGAHQRFEPWPGAVDRSLLTHRVTDRVVRAAGQGRPLSVSADRIGSPAMRGALLQHRWASEVWDGPEPRDGTGRLIETYPAAALRAWGIDAAGYKRQGSSAAPDARAVRSRIVAEVATAVASWCDVGPAADRCVASDHVLDALICTLVVVATLNGSTAGPSDDQAEAARVEGWIHVPKTDLVELGPPPVQAADRRPDRQPAARS